MNNCSTCFHRCLDDCDNSKCLIWGFEFLKKMDIFFTVCKEHKYEYPEDFRSSKYLKNIKREMKIIT